MLTPVPLALAAKGRPSIGSSRWSMRSRCLQQRQELLTGAYGRQASAMIGLHAHHSGNWQGQPAAQKRAAAQPAA